MKGESQQKAWKTLIAVSMAVFVVSVDYWAATVALPDMAKQFNVHAVTLQWVLTVYIISFCTTVSVAGRLGDIFGRKKLLLLGVALFGMFSVWVGLSNSFWMIIYARIALGIGGGLIFPLSTAVLGYATKPSEMSQMIGLLIGLGAVGAAVGPVIGGILTETMGWPWIFFMNLPIAIIAFVLISFWVSESKDEHASNSIDYLGIVLLLASIVSVALFVANLSVWGIVSVPIVGLGVSSIILFFLFKLHEERIEYPLVDISLFNNRTFAGYVSSGALSKIFLTCVIFTTTMLLQKVYSYDPYKTGLFFISISGTIAVSSIFLTHIERLFGTKGTMILSLMLQLIGGIILWKLSGTTWLIVGLAIAGPGCGWGFSIAMVGSINSLPKNIIGLASSAVLTIILMCAALGVTVAAAVIESYSASQSVEVGVDNAYFASVIACILGLVLAITVIPKLLNTKIELDAPMER